MAIELFSDKKNCCGCGACMNICPKNAITMEPDQEGFFYPVINSDLCISCKACKKACHEPKKAFAAVNRDEKQLMLSASGGVFSAIATKILKEGGVVFGAALSFDNGYANPHHIGIESIDDLPRLQGSKYVQSKIGETYKQAKQYLDHGRTVLFSGTPCQVAGLYGFLKKYYDNLITIDLICHGVPNEKLFNGYLQEQKKKRKAKTVTGYSFRDKSKGWGMIGRIDFLMVDNSSHSVYIPARLESYYTLFLDGAIYRENCYSCKYATKGRTSDLTIGDYWGIENEHPEYLGDNGYTIKNGISCVLANSEKGLEICDELKILLQLHKSAYEKICKQNAQLEKPSHKSKNRNKIFNLYLTEGYSAIESWYKREYRIKHIIYTIYYAIPHQARIKIKNIKLTLSK